MIKVNLKAILAGNNTSVGSVGNKSLIHSILPLSGEIRPLEKVPTVGFVQNPTIYQYCSICNTEQPHYQVLNAKGNYITCTKCTHGYKIS
jgi:hypothetical protein